MHIQPLEARRLLAAGDQDMSFGDEGLLQLHFDIAPYQFLPGSDPTGAATIVSVDTPQTHFAIRKLNNGVADESAGPNGIITDTDLPFKYPTTIGLRITPRRTWALSGGRAYVEFIANRPGNDS